MNASRQSFVASALICAMMAALFVARRVLAPYPVEAPFEGGMPLAASMVRFAAACPWIAAACAFAVTVWTMVMMTHMTVKFAPAASRNYLPSQILLVGMCGLVVSGETLAALTVALVVTLAVRRFALSFHKGYSFPEVFHAGFFLGFAPLLYAPVAAFALPVAISAMVVYRRSWREVAVCLAGLTLPVPAAGFVYWALGEKGDFIYRELWRCATEPALAGGVVSGPVVVTSSLVLALALVAVVWMPGHKKSVRNTPYKFMQHIALTLLFTVASGLLPGTSTTIACVAAVPCAASVPFAFQGRAAKASTILYMVIVAAVTALDLPPVLSALLP